MCIQSEGNVLYLPAGLVCKSDMSSMMSLHVRCWQPSCVSCRCGYLDGFDNADTHCTIGRLSHLNGLVGKPVDGSHQSEAEARFLGLATIIALAVGF